MFLSSCSCSQCQYGTGTELCSQGRHRAVMTYGLPLTIPAQHHVKHCVKHRKRHDRVIITSTTATSTATMEKAHAGNPPGVRPKHALANLSALKRCVSHGDAASALRQPQPVLQRQTPHRIRRKCRRSCRRWSCLPCRPPACLALPGSATAVAWMACRL